MASNHKLTAALEGRRVRSVEQEGETLTVTFEDGALMTVRTGAPVAPASTGNFAGKTVAAVRQAGTRLDLDFDGGGTLEVQTAEATSSVLLRDANGELEYAD